MTFLIPPPDWVVRELLHIDMATFMRQVTGTTLDRKTLLKVAMGHAAKWTMARMSKEYREHNPRLAGYVDAIRERRKKELAEIGRQEEFEMELSTGTWRSGIEAACMAAVEGGEPHLTMDLLRDHLLPLEDASFHAEVLWRKGAREEVLDVVECCALAPLLNMGRLRRDVEGVEDQKAFANAFKPVRAIGCLFILAAFERQLYTGNGSPGFETILPKQEGETFITPMAKLIQQLERGVTAPSQSAVRRHLLNRDSAEDASKLKKIRRWVAQGVFPERRNFETLVIGVAADRGRTDVDKQRIAFLYYALRALTSLGDMMKTSPAMVHFGGYNAFFSRYEDIVASLR